MHQRPIEQGEQPQTDEHGVTTGAPRGRLRGVSVQGALDRLQRWLGHDTLPLMAAALSYRTIFSLIPLLLVGLLTLQLFSNTDALIQQLLRRVIDQAGLADIVSKAVATGGDAGEAAALSEAQREAGLRQIEGWIQGILKGFRGLNFGAIGLVSALTLIYAAISLLVEVENSFNTVYGVARGRSFKQRVLQYWLVVTLGPLAVYGSFYVGERFTAAAERVVSTQIQAVEGAPGPQGASAARWEAGLASPTDPGRSARGTVEGAMAAVRGEALGGLSGAGLGGAGSGISQRLIRGVGFGVTVLISTVLLWVLYVIVPNTKVRVWAALAGALVGGVLLEVAKWGFRNFVTGAGYQSLYGSLALLPLFLMWVYVLWMIVLLGLRLAYLIQTGRRGRVVGVANLVERATGSGRAWWVDPAAGVPVLALVARAFGRGQGVSAEDLSRACGIEPRLVGQMLERMHTNGWVHRGAEEREGQWVLSMPAERIGLGPVLEACFELADAGQTTREVRESVVRRLRRAQVASVRGMSLASVLGAVLTDEDGAGPVAASDAGGGARRDAGPEAGAEAGQEAGVVPA
ncbi:MAG: hypothetical protein C0513_01300 [Isosphaera sp.]|nr:hypothetical protein [Isosphaera sp.]